MEEKEKLNLAEGLSKIHDVFHVSMLRKYILDPSHVLLKQLIELIEDLTYEERPLCILDRKEQVLRIKVISMVKILWINHGIEDATWKNKDKMKQRYPQLFSLHTTFQGQNSNRKVVVLRPSPCFETSHWRGMRQGLLGEKSSEREIFVKNEYFHLES